MPRSNTHEMVRIPRMDKLNWSIMGMYHASACYYHTYYYQALGHIASFARLHTSLH
jgi:hypothetical protein